MTTANLLRELLEALGDLLDDLVPDRYVTCSSVQVLVLHGKCTPFRASGRRWSAPFEDMPSERQHRNGAFEHVQRKAAARTVIGAAAAAAKPVIAHCDVGVCVTIRW